MYVNICQFINYITNAWKNWNLKSTVTGPQYITFTEYRFVLCFFFLHLVSYSLNFTILKQMHTPTCVRTHTHRKKWSQSERKKAILYLKRNPEEEYNIQVDCLEERVKYFPLIWLGVRYQLFTLSNAYLNSYSTYPVSFLVLLFSL